MNAIRFATLSLAALFAATGVLETAIMFALGDGDPSVWLRWPAVMARLLTAVLLFILSQPSEFFSEHLAK